MPDDNHLRDQLSAGHANIVLREDAPPEVRMRISDYNNSDNGQNQCVHDTEVIKACQRICKELDYLNHQATRETKPSVRNCTAWLPMIAMVSPHIDSVAERAT